MLGRSDDVENDLDRVSTTGYWIEAEDDGVDYMGADAGFVDVDFQIFSPSRSFGAEKYRNKGSQPTHWMPLPPAPGATHDA